MNVRKMSIDELEMLSFTDVAYNIIKLDKEAKTTVVLFKEICSLLGLSKKEYEDKIADFYTSLTTDKRFVLLASTNWDLRENNLVETKFDDSDEDMEEVDEDMDDLLADKEENDFADEEEAIDDDLEELDEDMEEFEDIDEIELEEEEEEEIEE